MLEDPGDPSGTGDPVVGTVTAGQPPPARTGGAPPGRKWVKRAEGDAGARPPPARRQSGRHRPERPPHPGSRSRTKQIAVSPAGVFVIDAKRYKGLVHTRRPGPIPSLGPDELHVGRRDCTPAWTRLAGQVEVGADALDSRRGDRRSPSTRCCA